MTLSNPLDIVKGFTVIVAQDGSGDYNGSDETPIQQALDLIASTGGEVHVKKGSYTINAPLSISSSCKLSGEGRSTVFLAKTAFDDNVIESNGRVSSVELTAFTINGDSANQTTGNGIYINGYYNWISDLWVTNCKQSGIEFNSGGSASSENRISNCRFNGLEKGIWIGSNNNDFYITDTTAYGGEYNIYMNGSGGKITNCMAFSATIASIFTTVAQIFDTVRISSTAIGIYIDGSANNIYGEWQGLSISNPVFSTISDHCILVDIGNTYEALININGFVGTSTNEDLSFVGAGTINLRGNSTKTFITVDDTATLQDDSVFLQPLTSESAEPTSPCRGMVYLDDGTNTTSGQMGFRSYRSTGWIDISPLPTDFNSLGILKLASIANDQADTDSYVSCPIGVADGKSGWLRHRSSVGKSGDMYSSYDTKHYFVYNLAGVMYWDYYTSTASASATNKMSLDASGNLAIAGTVDGRDVATDGIKLDTMPNITFGQIYTTGGSTEQTITTAGTYEKVTGFATDGISDNATASSANDNITLPADGAGTYKISLAICFSGTVSSTWKFKVRKNGSADVAGLTLIRKLGTGGDIGSSSISGLATLANSDVITIEATSDGDGDGMTIVDATLNVRRIH